MVARLRSVERQNLHVADRQLVVNALAQVINSASGPWLPPGHPTQSGVNSAHSPTGAAPLTATQMAEYLALAAPNHCTDGWIYLSRALNAYLLGDPHSAWHFAYYAELRAAQSILAASGCGVFNTWNAVINAGGHVVQVDDLTARRNGRVLGTHSMTWLALPEVLTHSPGGRTALSNAAEILSYSLADLVAYAFPGQSSTQAASRWITDWTYDISLGLGDRDFRNRCSYDPHLVTPHAAEIDDAVSFIETFWTSFQPSPGAYFLDLDKHLLRRALIDQANEKLSRNHGAAPHTQAQVSAEVGAAYDRMCASAPQLASIPKVFFLHPGPMQNDLLAASSDRSQAPSNPQPALSRASLLLRMATGIARRLLIDAGYQNGTELDFWFSALAIDHGLVASYHDIAGDRSSLYGDCAVAVEDLLTAYSEAIPPVVRTTVINHPRVRPHAACEATRIPHWGLQP